MNCEEQTNKPVSPEVYLEAIEAIENVRGKTEKAETVMLMLDSLASTIAESGLQAHDEWTQNFLDRLSKRLSYVYEQVPPATTIDDALRLCHQLGQMVEMYYVRYRNTGTSDKSA